MGNYSELKYGTQYHRNSIRGYTQKKQWATSQLPIANILT